MSYWEENGVYLNEDCEFVDLALYLQTLWEVFVIRKSVLIKQLMNYSMLLEKIQFVGAPVDQKRKVALKRLNVYQTNGQKMFNVFDKYIVQFINYINDSLVIAIKPNYL